jgi:hypothetical protein
VLKHFALIFVASLVLVFYQNCAPQHRLQKPGSGSAGEVVIASTQNVAKVAYDPVLESQPPSVPSLLSVDLNSGQASIRGNNGVVKSCALDDSRLHSLIEILSSGQVCEPERVLGAIYCQALGAADIKLEDPNSDSTLLRPVVCHYGQYLCDGQDENFRSLLQSIVQTPPSGCN